MKNIRIITRPSWVREFLFAYEDANDKNTRPGMSEIMRVIEGSSERGKKVIIDLADDIAVILKDILYEDTDSFGPIMDSIIQAKESGEVGEVIKLRAYRKNCWDIIRQIERGIS